MEKYVHIWNGFVKYIIYIFTSDFCPLVITNYPNSNVRLLGNIESYTITYFEHCIYN